MFRLNVVALACLSGVAVVGCGGSGQPAHDPSTTSSTGSGTTNGMPDTSGAAPGGNSTSTDGSVPGNESPGTGASPGSGSGAGTSPGSGSGAGTGSGSGGH
jgi:hypothetical protein